MNINPQDLMSLMQNPQAYLMSKGFNIPNNVQFSTPKDIVMYLMNSGQTDQNTYNQAYQAAQSMGYKL